jgi:hypothetical protein
MEVGFVLINSGEFYSQLTLEKSFLIDGWPIKANMPIPPFFKGGGPGETGAGD